MAPLMLGALAGRVCGFTVICLGPRGPQAFPEPFTASPSLPCASLYINIGRANLEEMLVSWRGPQASAPGDKFHLLVGRGNSGKEMKLGSPSLQGQEGTRGSLGAGLTCSQPGPPRAPSRPPATPPLLQSLLEPGVNTYRPWGDSQAGGETEGSDQAG